MDEIHIIQTRGAVAVETFTIHSKEYIAIAQSQDSTGSFEVCVCICNTYLIDLTLLRSKGWNSNP